MSAHEAPGRSDEWYTPRRVFEALGARFDLDVAHPGLDVVDWVPAAEVAATRAARAEAAGAVAP